MSYSFSTDPTTLAEAPAAVEAAWAKCAEVIRTPEHNHLVDITASALRALADRVDEARDAHVPTVSDTLFRVSCSGHANPEFGERAGYSLTHFNISLSQVAADAPSADECH